MRDSERYEEDLLPAAFFIFCFAKRAEVAKASPNLKNKEVTMELCQIWNQLGDEEKAPYFSAAAKYPRRDRAEMGEIVKTVVSDLIEHVVEEVGEEEVEAEEVMVEKGRKRSKELVGEEHPNKQPRIDEEKYQKSPQYKAEESEDEEEHEVVDIADEDEDVEEEEVMEVSDAEDEDIFINPFHQPDPDEDDNEVEVTREVALADPEDEVEVTREVAADPRAALERAASKKLEAVKR